MEQTKTARVETPCAPHATSAHIKSGLFSMPSLRPRLGSAQRLLTTSAVLTASFVLFGGCASRAQADPGAPFSAVSVNATPGGVTDSSAEPLGSGISNVVVRATQTGASQVEIDGDGSVSQVGSGDVAWSSGNDFNPGDTPSIEAIDEDESNDATASAEFFTVPAGPVSYSGVSSTDSDESTLPFITLGDAPYVANVTVSGGAVMVGGGDSDGQTFESAGQVSLGTISSGGGSVTVTPVAGPQTAWTVSITPVPIVLSNVSLNHSVAQPGVIDTLRFATDGATHLNATIKSAAGVVVRALASGFSEGSGNHTLVWDGRNAAGDPVPTGLYTADLSSTDPLGNVSSGSASIEIDSTPPTAALQTASVRPTQAVRVKFEDVGSGIGSASIQIGSIRRTLPSGEHTVSYAPERWTIGRHTLVATARDNAGNTTSQTFTFTVKGKPIVKPPLVYSLINCPRKGEQNGYAATKFTPGGCGFVAAAERRLLATINGNQNHDITVRYQHKSYALSCQNRDYGVLESCYYKRFLVVRVYYDSASAPRNYKFPTRT
jgi:hypothetical protein